MTALRYQTFRCAARRRSFNERTGTPFNFLEYPTDVVLVVVLWRLRSKLSLRDLAGMSLERGFVFTHEAIREWEGRFTPLFTQYRWTLGRKVVHRWNRYLENRLEQDHCGIKQWYYPMRGFGSFEAATRFCTARGEPRDYLRCRQRQSQPATLTMQYQLFRVRWAALMILLDG